MSGNQPRSTMWRPRPAPGAEGAIPARKRYTVKGLVTDPDPLMATFRIDGVITVYAGLLMAQGRIGGLPKGGTEVTVRAEHHDCDPAGDLKAVIPCAAHGGIEGDFEPHPETPSSFINTVREFTLGPQDVLRLVNAGELLITLTTIENLLGYLNSLAKYLGVTGGGAAAAAIARNEQAQCETNWLPRFTITTLDCFKHVDENIMSKFDKFEYYTFGAHSSKPNQYLMGQLILDGRYSSVQLRGIKEGRIPCQISDNGMAAGLGLSGMFGRLVAIKKYTVIVELYNYPKIVRCVLFDLRDVVLLEARELKRPVCRNVFVTDYYFSVINRSTPAASTHNQLELWIDAWFPNEFRRLPVCLDGGYTQYLPMIQVGGVYKLSVSPQVKWPKAGDKYLFLYKRFNVNIEPVTSFSQLGLSDTTGPLITVRDVREAWQYVKTDTTGTPISFQGRIAGKKFGAALESRAQTHRPPDYVGYGITGLQTPLLEFAVDGGNVLTLYVNDWHNNTTPLGLVPGVTVIVRHCVVQKNRYLKCDKYTAFEVLGFEPEVPFESAYLTSNRAIADWGPPTAMGYNSKIPTNTIVWNRLAKYEILSMNIVKTGAALNPMITLKVWDDVGASTVQASGEEGLVLLRVLLQMQPPAFAKYLTTWDRLGICPFTFEKEAPKIGNNAAESQVCQIHEADKFRVILNFYMRGVNTLGLNFDLMCRRCVEEPGGCDWVLVDARGRLL